MPPEKSKDLLAYTPMLHARLFQDHPKYRDHAIQPIRTSLPSPPLPYSESGDNQSDLFLDGNPKFDRPLIVQFCANNPDELLQAAKYIQPFCDAVDLNLGCPQGIARKGHYGAFLQEDQDLIHSLINCLRGELDIPVTAKIRILESKEETLKYAKRVLDAGASILTVHGRQREQKGHNTGLADWSVIRYLRDNLPQDTVLFANGNILRHDDIERCLEATKADGVMSAEGNLHDPSIFAAPPPPGSEGREYWRGRDGKEGYRMDAVMRRYMDIIYEYVLETKPPARSPLFIPSDPILEEDGPAEDEGQPPAKKQKRTKAEKPTSPSLLSMQAHLFQLLRPLITKHTNVRDALARAQKGDMPAYENVLWQVERATRDGLLEYEAEMARRLAEESKASLDASDADEISIQSSTAMVDKCKRPWWVCQPYVRPLPEEALKKGSLTLGKKELARREREEEQAKTVGLEPDGRLEKQKVNGDGEAAVDIPREGLVCG